MFVSEDHKRYLQTNFLLFNNQVWGLIHAHLYNSRNPEGHNRKNIQGPNSQEQFSAVVDGDVKKILWSTLFYKGS